MKLVWKRGNSFVSRFLDILGGSGGQEEGGEDRQELGQVSMLHTLHLHQPGQPGNFFYCYVIIVFTLRLA